MPRNASYIQDVDRLIEQTPLSNVLHHYGLPPPEKSSGEHRMVCPFNAECRDSQYGNLTVNLDSPAKLIYAHCCDVRGSLLMLIHGLESGRPPSSGRLRGDEFKAAVNKLKEINGLLDTPTVNRGESLAAETYHPATPPADPPPENIALRMQDKTKGLVNLWEECVVDVADMSPPAAAYFRERPWLTPEVCRKWKLGYLPSNGRSLLRGMVIYAHENEAGEILSYSGRDVRFDEKWQNWIRDGRPERKKPNKHRYVKGYHKGLQLYGEQANRLLDRKLKESLGQLGLVLVEGQNDVIRLDALGIAAIGLCSNRATDEQIAKIVRIAQRASQGRVILMPDNDEEGESGAQDLLWELASQGLTVKLAWSRTSHDGRFNGMQPENLTEGMWQHDLRPFLSRP
ncbi:MAG: toprim domain-containing protein [Planctomycetaceae bacterium]|nr:toprim domain-containing protein [Planctomycetaceae bacterium]